MATWQFDICFVPETLIAGKSISDVELDNLRSLEKLKLQNASLKALIGKLAPLKSWNKELESFGQMDGDRIDVSYEGTVVSEIMVRIDVRRVDKDFIQRLVEFAKRNRVEMVDLENRVSIGAQERLLLAAILNSKAKEFVIDPETFLDGFIAERR